MQEQLAEVVDRIRYQGCEAEVVGALDALFLGEVLEVHAGEIQKGVPVVGGELLLSLGTLD